ncbi:MAG: LicD family protein [Bacteroidaceae bacterium]|nr:LicD family protein [Bacteroidaceae bacterium]
MDYKGQELQKLQQALYVTLGEVDRVCKKHGIRYFVTGGTAVGVYFWHSILPWDDDVDVGMLRPDYERFAAIAQEEMGDRFFLQTPDTEPHTPFFFMKVRMNGSRFSEATFKGIKMHQGIYVDIFPFDKIPKQAWLERLQHNVLFFLNGLFIAKEIWQWKHCGKCDIPEPRRRGWLPCFFTRLLITLLSKRTIYNIMYRVQTAFNDKPLPLCKNIITKSERLPIEDVKQAQTATLGPLQVSAPRDLLLYLTNHYGTVRKDVPDEMKVSHRPEELVFPKMKNEE